MSHLFILYSVENGGGYCIYSLKQQFQDNTLWVYKINRQSVGKLCIRCLLHVFKSNLYLLEKPFPSLELLPGVLFMDRISKATNFAYCIMSHCTLCKSIKGNVKITGNICVLVWCQSAELSTLVLQMFLKQNCEKHHFFLMLCHMHCVFTLLLLRIICLFLTPSPTHLFPFSLSCIVHCWTLGIPNISRYYCTC